MRIIIFQPKILKNNLLEKRKIHHTVTLSLNMKLIGNIVCTIAILTQIILSAGLFAHAPDCQDTQSLSYEHTDSHNTTAQPTHHCGCTHHHSSNVQTSEDISLCERTPNTPLHDCTCTPQKNHPYHLSHQIPDQKPKDQVLKNSSLAATHIDLSQFSLLLTITNHSKAPPRVYEQIYLPQHHARFTSIHLGVFTI